MATSRQDHPTDPVVVLDRVSVVRGHKRVIQDLTCEVCRGEVVGLIGPSGCGKTTLMRSIVGVQARVDGSVTVLGRPAGEASREGRVGYMAQDPSVYDDLSVSENLSYFAKLLGAEQRRVIETLESVQLAGEANALVGEISGGQRARVSLAIALLAEPDLLVLDEPTVGLDPVLRQELWSDFSALAADGTTLLVSSHVMDEAQRCDTLLLMRNGQILADGPPTELMSRTGTGTLEDAFLAVIAAEDQP